MEPRAEYNAIPRRLEVAANPKQIMSSNFHRQFKGLTAQSGFLPYGERLGCVRVGLHMAACTVR
jgi:hypothetical protein